MASLAPKGAQECWTAECAVPGAAICAWRDDCPSDATNGKSKPAYPRIVSKSVGKRTCDPTKARLAQTIEAEIIPRLMLAAPVLSSPSGELTGKIDVAEFTCFVIAPGPAAIIGYIAAHLDHGMPFQAICLDLLAPAARRLGVLWERDLIDLSDVAIGMMRLQHVMTVVEATKRSCFVNRADQRRALLISLPGETHNFGLYMVASFFRRANWDVRAWPRITNAELAAAVRNEPKDIVGVSISCAEQLDRARAAISLIRKASRYRAPKIIVGGLYLTKNPRAAAEIGADASSPDGLDAPEMSNKIVRILQKC